MKRIIKAIFILNLSFSCGGSVSTHSEPPDQMYSLQQVGEVSFPLDSLTGFGSLNIQAVSTGNTKRLYIEDFKSRYINIYDIDRETLVDKTPLAEDGPNDVGPLSGFFVHTHDSVYVYSSRMRRLSLINNKGQVLDTYTTHIGNQHEPFLYMLSIQPIFIKNNKLYGCTILIDPGVEDHTEINVTWVLDLETRSIDYLNSRPALYNQGSWGMGGYMLRAYHTYNPEKNLYIQSFGIDPNIHVYDSAGNREVFYAGTKDIKKIGPVTKDRTEMIHDNEGFRHEASSGFYSTIIHDPYNRVYFRYAHLPIPGDEYSSPAQLFKNITIIILDDSFKKVGEYALSPDYTSDMFFITEAGIHIANQKKHEQDEDTLTFDVFNLNYLLVTFKKIFKSSIKMAKY